MKYKFMFLFILGLAFSACTKAPRRTDNSHGLLRLSRLFGAPLEPKFAYMTNLYPPALSPPIVVCDVDDETGQLMKCKDAGATNTGQPSGISIVKIGLNSYVYTANTISGIILQCLTQNDTGLITKCMSANPTSTRYINLVALSFHPAKNDQIYAYFNNQQNAYPYLGSILKCTINSTTGQFSQCVDSGIGSTLPGNINGIVFNQAGTYVYVSTDQGVKMCSVNNVGSFSNCDSAGPMTCPCQQPPCTTCPAVIGASIALTTVNENTYAFLGTNTSGISQCLVNSLNGTFTSCSVSAPLNNSAQTKGISFQTIFGQKYGYIADFNNNVIWQCKVNSQTANLENCIQLQSTNLDYPGYFGIGFPYQAGVLN